MNARLVPIPLPEILRKRAANLGVEVSGFFTGTGNAVLLREPLLGVIASRACPGNVLLQTVELVPDWIKAGKVIISGFHSPLEQQILRSALRRGGRVVIVLASGLDALRVTKEEASVLEEGNILVVSTLPESARRTTRASALERNRLVLALAGESCIPYIEPGSPLKEIVIKLTR
jgi:predicted Rossmann fold nucleotide-binding protein DprA/Smf involved in DNA uptake